MRSVSSHSSSRSSREHMPACAGFVVLRSREDMQGGKLAQGTFQMQHMVVRLPPLRLQMSLPSSPKGKDKRLEPTQDVLAQRHRYCSLRA